MEYDYTVVGWDYDALHPWVELVIARNAQEAAGLAVMEFDEDYREQLAVLCVFEGHHKTVDDLYGPLDGLDAIANMRG